MGIKNADIFMKEITVFPSYSPHHRLQFTGFTGTTPATEKFNDEKAGKERSAFEYFREVKNISINPDIPLATVRPRQAGAFPSEKLIILPYQRVALEFLESRLTDELHKVCHKRIVILVLISPFRRMWFPLTSAIVLFGKSSKICV